MAQPPVETEAEEQYRLARTVAYQQMALVNELRNQLIAAEKEESLLRADAEAWRLEVEAERREQRREAQKARLWELQNELDRHGRAAYEPKITK